MEQDKQDEKLQHTESKIAGNEVPLDFTALFEKTSNMIYSLGYRLFQNPEDALDFSQEVYTQAWRKRHSFRGQSKPSTWIYAIGLNLGLNRVKRNRLLSFTSIDEVPENIMSAADSQGKTSSIETDVIEGIEKKENANIIYQELNNLEDAYRIPLLLYYFERLSYKEIARSLKIKENTLKSYIHRGKKILAYRLKDKVRYLLSGKT